MPRLPRLHARGGTVHIVDRCNNRECCFTTPDDFRLLLARFGELARTSEVTLYNALFPKLTCDMALVIAAGGSAAGSREGGNPVIAGNCGLRYTRPRR